MKPFRQNFAEWLYFFEKITMEFKFSERGYLMPPGKIETSFEAFQKAFVSCFPLESSRHGLFVGYLHFLKDFKEQVTLNFTQWIGGSFVTQKESPSDIDFVTLIDFEIYQEKENLIDTSFRAKAAAEKYGVDAFTLRKYPENHPKFALTNGDLAYWHDLWLHTRKDRWGQKHRKGFLELKF